MAYIDSKISSPDMLNFKLFYREETSSSSGFEQRYFSDLHKYGRNLSFQYHEMTQSQDASPALLTDEDGFKSAAKICREFLSTFLAGPVLDSLSESARQVRTFRCIVKLQFNPNGAGGGILCPHFFRWLFLNEKTGLEA